MRLSHAVFFVAVSLVCLSASRCAAPASSAEGPSVSIVAYNVKSLFDAVDDGTEFPEFSVAKGKWDEARYKIRLSNVAAAVLASTPDVGSPPGPDILCLEEIENEKVLEALRTGPLAPARYRYAAIAPAEGGPFSVCALSRLPILASSCHYAATPAGRAGRDLLELEFDALGRRLFVLACHWKSKSGGAEETEEAACASTPCTVATHHCRPRIAVGIASRFSPSAMARRVAPDDRSAMMRATISSGMSRGRPRRTPAALLTASADFVRSPMSRRSNWAKVASIAAIASPAGVEVSTLRSSAMSAQRSLLARSISPAKSTSDRLRRSSFETTNVSALRWRRASNAASMPGRWRSLPLNPASST